MARTDTPMTAAATEAVASCSGLVRIYPTASGETHALRGVDAEFDRGSVTALTGPSGSGKSTLLALLALRDRPSGGEVAVLGRPTSSMGPADRRRLSRGSIAWVPQRPTDGVFGHLTARQNVEQSARWRGGTHAEGADLLERLGLADVGSVLAARLSGGEQQRLAVACACVGTPALVLCDEPTAELDEETAALVLGQLRATAATGSAVVVATHDPDAVAASDRVVALRHGVVSTERRAGAEARATIDPTGRVQLPPEALLLFPDRRATLRLEGGRVVLEPPEDAP